MQHTQLFDQMQKALTSLSAHGPIRDLRSCYYIIEPLIGASTLKQTRAVGALNAQQCAHVCASTFVFHLLCKEQLKEQFLLNLLNAKSSTTENTSAQTLFSQQPAECAPLMNTLKKEQPKIYQLVHMCLMQALGQLRDNATTSNGDIRDPIVQDVHWMCAALQAQQQAQHLDHVMQHHQPSDSQSHPNTPKTGSTAPTSIIKRL